MTSLKCCVLILHSSHMNNAIMLVDNFINADRDVSVGTSESTKLIVNSCLDAQQVCVLLSLNGQLIIM